MRLLELFPALLDIQSEGSTAFPAIRALHSGNLGDVIYSLPTAFALGVNHLVLNACADPAFGGRVMNSDTARMLAPLLLAQGNIHRVTVIHSQVPWEYVEPERIGVDYVLDAFRHDWTEPSLHLIYRHALPFGIRVRGDIPWLVSEECQEGDLPEGVDKPYLVVSLTSRYRRWGDDYYESLLANVPSQRVIFVGVESDLAHKVNVPGAFLMVDDFRHLARVLASAALVIGNPSFPYALAEALKVPRLVEHGDDMNVAPLDASGAALHLYSHESLRTRVFDALGLPTPDHDNSGGESLAREERAALLARHAAELEGKLQVEQEEKRLLGLALTQLTIEHARVLQNSRSSRRGRKSYGGRIKNALRSVIRSNDTGRRVFDRLSKVSVLRRLWHGTNHDSTPGSDA